MKRSHECPKCKSKKILEDVRVIDRGHGNSKLEFSLETYEKPDALFFKGTHSSDVRAWVCSDCGFVEFYASHVEALEEARKQKSDL